MSGSVTGRKPPMTNIPSHPTLVDFLDSVSTEHDAYPVFKRIVANKSAFAAGDIPTSSSISIVVEGRDIIHPFLDAVAFGIFWEQESPAYYREQPDETHFGLVRGFSSTEEIISAQNKQLAAFFACFRDNHEHGLEEVSPPAIHYQGVEISTILHEAVIFGELFEMWYAEEYHLDHGDPISLLEPE